jgi:hypothetical protein
MNGTKQGAEVFKEATGRGGKDALIDGVNADDGCLFLSHVAVVNSVGEKRYSYNWRRLGNNGEDKSRPFKVSHLYSIFKKPGKYVLLCSNRRKHSEKYKMFMKRLKDKRSSEEKRFCEWSTRVHPKNKSFVRCATEHAVAVVVHEDFSRKLYDNGLRNGVANFTVEKLAERVDDVAACYAFEMSELVN